MLSNKPVSEQYADAIIEAGKAKVEAMRARKKADRILDACFLAATGKNAEERKAHARQDERFKSADLEAEKAELEEIAARSQANALQVAWESWRTEAANDRAAMNLR
jgi:hypothetical protein